MGVVSQVGALATLAGILVAVGVWILLDYRTTPEKLERTRRLMLNRRGRLADGILTNATSTSIYYAYSINGVAYNASQDIANLSQHLTSDPERLAGPVWLKYAPQNPANSIVLCEQWSGLPPAPAASQSDAIPQQTSGDSFF